MLLLALDMLLIITKK